MTEKLTIAEPTPPMVWIRGYAVATEIEHWLDNFERHGRPEGFGLIVCAHANKPNIGPEAVRRSVERCRALDVPYHVGLTMMPDTGPSYRDDSQWSLTWWGDTRTWMWLREQTLAIAELRFDEDAPVFGDIEGYRKEKYPLLWPKGAPALLTAIDAIRSAEKKKDAARRDDELLKQLSDLRVRCERDYQTPRRDWPPILFDELATAMKPFTAAMQSLNTALAVFPASLDNATMRVLQDHVPTIACDETTYSVALQYAELRAKGITELRFETAFAGRKAQFNRRGFGYCPGFYDHLLRDYAQGLRAELDHDCWVYPRKDQHAGAFTPSWLAAPLEPRK